MKTCAPSLKFHVKPSLHKNAPWLVQVLICLLCCSVSLKTSAQFVYTLYKESVGSYAGTISVDAYTGWSSGTRYAHTVPLGTAFVSNLIIPSNYAGASGGTPVTVSTGSTWIISGINTSAFSAINLSFGIHKSNFRASGADMNIEVSSDGVTYTTLSWPLLPTTNGSGDTWHLKEGGTAVTGTIPATTNLRIRFRNASTHPYDFDDIQLKGTSALPLQLLSFNATKANKGYDLRWTTNGETNVAHFLVQGSPNGMHYYNLRQVNARNSGVVEEYTVNDISHAQQTFYYRLCWVEDNGATKYSSIVKTNPQSAEKLKIISNPAINDVIVLTGPGNHEDLSYVLYNASGQIIRKGKLSIPNAGKYMIPANGLTPGRYLLHIGNNQKLHQLPVIIL